MNATHRIQCTCGALRGEVERTHRVNRGPCYCADCQSYAHFLGRADEILDARGGTEVIQVPPRKVKLTSGVENYACMRLTKNRLMRWYASCCNTPIGNTLANHKLSFVGLVHNCLRADAEHSLDESFAPLRMRGNTTTAKGSPPPAPAGSRSPTPVLLS